jgi:hypothetical protein
MNKICVNGFTRVTYLDSLKRYIKGESIYVVPCKVRPDEDAPFVRPAIFNRSDSTEDFKKRINEFNFFNCSYRELGLYPAFYIKDGDENGAE